MDEQKARAKAWFEALRDEICTAFEALEAQAPATLYPGPAGVFERKPWTRAEGQGGGVGGFLKGRFFEKVGVHVSTVMGEFPADYAKQVKGAGEDPRFWASGISLIAHMRNPHCPAAHMNTRMIMTSEWWFGGGGDLNPTQAAQRSQEHPDAQTFHGPYREACEAYRPGAYADYKTWADEYFWLPHRGEPRGVGGVFYDHLNSGDWERDFAFTQAIGRAFLAAYLPVLQRRMHEPWTPADRAEQARQRGRYVEFNLLYDRGTVFGLRTGGNVETILSSMPPEATWD